MILQDKTWSKIDTVFKDIYEHVALSLGPEGRTVIISQDKQHPIITKDGATIAKHYKSEDPIGALVMQIIKEVCASTDLRIGDGTTSTIIFAYNLYKQLRNSLKAGYNYNLLMEGVDKAVYETLQGLMSYSVGIKDAEDLRKVAFVSTNNDKELSDLIFNAVDVVGQSGAIITSRSNTGKTEVIVQEGFTFPAGWISRAMVTEDNTQAVKYENPRIFITDHYIRDIQADLTGILSFALRDERPIVIIAENIEGSALASIVASNLSAKHKICAIRAPFFGRAKRGFLEDVALFTGGKFISKEEGMTLAQVTLRDFGSVDFFESKWNSTLMTGSKTDESKISQRIEFLTNLMVESKEDEELFQIYTERASRLGSGSANIRIGGNVESEITEKRYRIEDALKAIQAAYLQGTIVGGGVIPLRIHESLRLQEWDDETTDDFLYGYNSIIYALPSMHKQLMLSAKMDKERKACVSKILSVPDAEYGFNLKTKEYGNLREMGIIEPAATLVSVINNSVSIVKLLLNSSGIIL
jgi:chaperonin GroEL